MRYRRFGRSNNVIPGSILIAVSDIVLYRLIEEKRLLRHNTYLVSE